MQHENNKTSQNVAARVCLLAVLVMAGGSYAAAEPPAPAPEGSAPPPEAGDVQERAVMRDQRTQPQLKKTAPATAQPMDKSGMGILQPGILSAPTPSAPSTGGTGPLPVVGGTFEPNYKYPWVVRMNGCGGVLLDAEWVLTAAHCVTPGIGFGKLMYTRTDPYTGSVSTETRAPAAVGARRDGVFIHPNYTPSNDQANDIALIKLASPFTISPYLQTVGLPRISRNPGMVGTVASFSHTGTLPAGQAAIFRGPVSQLDSPTKLFVQASAANASLCPGDSGSGFVTVESGRATVRGVASQGSVGDCMTPNGEAVFTDIFAFRGWILQTMGKSDNLNTRVRWGGKTARGVMGLGCLPNPTIWGPLNVVGVEEANMCDAGQTQTIMCNLDKNQGNVGTQVPVLSGLTVRTTVNGSAQVQTIPASGNTASFFGVLPAGASREFTCQIGNVLTSGTIGNLGGNMAVMSRGIEEGQSTEPTVEQPSPFDPTDGAKP
jgi:hypothetical protein